MDKSERAGIRKILLITTAVFAAAALCLVFFVKMLPTMICHAADRAIESERYEPAYRLIEKMDDDTAADYRNKCDYSKAVSDMNSGLWEEASELLKGLGGYENSAELYNSCIYSLGEEYLKQSEWEKAEESFHAIVTYSDAEEREKEARYSRASELMSAGDNVSAFVLYQALGDYLDSNEQALKLAYMLVGERDLEKALAYAENLSPEEVALRKELSEYRNTLRTGVVDTGFYHTVALKENGTVLACGDNTYGQCDVTAWNNVTEIAAGAYHTVALFKDGTVAVTGRNTENQGDVSAWEGITHIAASDYATFGIKNDGTVLYCGYYDYYMLPEWTGVTMITAGSYSVAGLRGGEALISHVTARDESLTGLVDIAVTTGFAIGLKENGRVVSGQTELDWQRVVSVCAGPNCCLGLTAEGKVYSHFFRQSETIDMSGLSGVVSMAAGATHFAFVHQDGTVSVLGENSHGQADTSEWNLKG